MHQINCTITQPFELISETSKTAISSNNNPFKFKTSIRSSMRRMRTETRTSIKTWPSIIGRTDVMKDENNSPLQVFRNLEANLSKAFENRDYTEALKQLSSIENLGEKYIETAEFIVGNVFKGQFNQTRAFLLALMENPEAISLCDSGYGHLSNAFLRASAWMDEMGTELTSIDVEGIIHQQHLFYRGLLQLSIGEKLTAAQDLQNSIGTSSTDNYLIHSWGLKNPSDRIEMTFFLKILEQRMNTPLLPIQDVIDPTDPNALFQAGKYTEVISLIESHKNFEPNNLQMFGEEWYSKRQQREYDFLLKGASLALLGQTFDAIQWFEQQKEIKDNCNAMINLTHFLSGDLETARTGLTMSCPVEQIFVPIPLYTSSCFSTNFLRQTLHLAINGCKEKAPL